MKYAIWLPADQTILYLRQDGFNETIKYPQAGLWDSKEVADGVIKALLVKYFGDNLCKADKNNVVQIRRGSYGQVEEVENEEKFRAQEDTW